MKNIIRIFAITCFFTLAISMNYASAQPSPDEQGNSSSAGGAPISGGGAPIGNGEIFLFAFLALYSGRKVYVVSKLQAKQV
ncbi:MAG: hypothetical protein WCR72_18260 [Bacteroidota bacterium]